MSFANLMSGVDRDVVDVVGGEPVIYHPQAGPAVTGIFGIFEDSFLLVQGAADDGVETKVPTLFLRLGDLPTDPRIDTPTFTIRGLSYRIWKRQPAEFGSILLWLRKIV